MKSRLHPETKHSEDHRSAPESAPFEHQVPRSLDESQEVPVIVQEWHLCFRCFSPALLFFRLQPWHGKAVGSARSAVQRDV